MLPQDFNLAERNYDTAIEVNPNVKVPVYLSLAKLKVRQAWARPYQLLSGAPDVAGLASGAFTSALSGVENTVDTDTVLMAVLCALLALLVHWREQWYRGRRT